MFRLFGRTPHRHPIRGVLVFVLLTVAGLAAGAALAAPAWADAVTGASPSPGSSWRSPPGSVRLTFDRMVLPGSGAISVTGPDGRVATGRALASEYTLSADLPRRMAAGSYTVSWQVTFIFGGPLADSYRFRIKPKPKPAPTATTPTPSPTRTPAATATTTPAAGTEAVSGTEAVLTSAAPTTTPPPTATAPRVAVISATGTGSLPPPAVLWAVIAIVGLAGFGVYRWRRGASMGRN